MRVEIVGDVAVSPNLAAGDGGACCAYPLTAALGDGAIATVYRRGTSKHSHDGVLVMQTSGDGGAHWAEPVTIFDGTKLEPSKTAVTGGLVQTRSGALVAVFGVVEGLRPGVYMFDEEGQTLPRKILTTRSEDGGRTWSPPEPLETPGLSRAGIVARPFLLGDSEIALTLEHRTPLGAQGTAMVFSSDDGLTFGDLAIVAADAEGKLSLCDARVAVLTDGRILMLLWTFRQDTEETIEVHRTLSTDHGRTWSEPTGIGLVGQITVPLALPSGPVIAVSNVRVPPEGSQLWCSLDVGTTWASETRVQMWDVAEARILGQPVAESTASRGPSGIWDDLQRFSFGTPDLVLLDDGSVLMTYYATLDEIIHVRACRFRVDVDND